MVGVVETFTIAGAVAALISSFEGAATLFRTWRSQRAKAKDNDRCREVQRSLSKNSAKVEQGYDIGYRHLGSSFAKGDTIAHNSLLRATNRFNRTLIECQRMALARSFEPDLKNLWQVSEQIGHEALSTLGDLYQRLAQARSIPRTLSIESSSTQNTSSQLSLQLLKDVQRTTFRTDTPLPLCDDSVNSCDQLWRDLSGHCTFDNQSYFVSNQPITRPDFDALELDLINIRKRCQSRIGDEDRTSKAVLQSNLEILRRSFAPRACSLSDTSHSIR